MYIHSIFFFVFLLFLSSAFSSSNKNENLLLKVLPDSKDSSTYSMSNTSKDQLQDGEEYYTVEFSDENTEHKKNHCPYGNSEKSSRPNIHIFPIQQSGGCCPSSFQPPIPKQSPRSMDYRYPQMLPPQPQPPISYPSPTPPTKESSLPSSPPVSPKPSSPSPQISPPPSPPSPQTSPSKPPGGSSTPPPPTSSSKPPGGSSTPPPPTSSSKPPGGSSTPPPPTSSSKPPGGSSTPPPPTSSSKPSGGSSTPPPPTSSSKPSGGSSTPPPPTSSSSKPSGGSSTPSPIPPKDQSPGVQKPSVQPLPPVKPLKPGFSNSNQTQGSGSTNSSSSTNSTSGSGSSTNNTSGSGSSTNNTSGSGSSTNNTSGSGSSTNNTSGSGSSTNNTSGSGSSTNNTSGSGSSTNNTSGSGSSTNNTSGSGGDVSVSEQEFNSAVTACGYPQPPSDKYNGFISGIPKSGIDSKRELAMFLANILHESDGLQAKSEIQCEANGCKGQYDAAADGTVYFGRGYTQLTWKANYAAASKDLYGDENKLLSNPQLVAEDEEVAWATAFWYWKTRVHTAPGVTEGKFGATTKAINGALECGGGENPKAKKRFEYYTKIMKAFGVNDTPIESGCYN